mgnify:CR=1 FL=1
MVKRIIIILIFIAFLIFPNLSLALRCGSDLVDVGDLKIKVQLACGEPFSKVSNGYIDQIRYTVQEDNGNKEIVGRVRVMSVEEWIIKDKNNYYSLVFEGNILKTIKWAVRD